MSNTNKVLLDQTYKQKMSTANPFFVKIELAISAQWLVLLLVQSYNVFKFHFLCCNFLNITWSKLNSKIWIFVYLLLYDVSTTLSDEIQVMFDMHLHPQDTQSTTYFHTNIISFEPLRRPQVSQNCDPWPGHARTPELRSRRAPCGHPLTHDSDSEELLQRDSRNRLTTAGVTGKAANIDETPDYH